MILGLPFSNSGTDPLAFPALSILEILAFLRGLLPQLVRTNALSVLIPCMVSTVIYIATLPLVMIPYRLGITQSPYPWSEDEQPSLQQDIIIRLVRHAFKTFPYSIGRAFFSEQASIPLMQARYGGTRHFEERCAKVKGGLNDAEGWWITTHDANSLKSREDFQDPLDLVIMYIHGGGLTMGSPAFYLHFLGLFVNTLKDRGFRRPAVFAPAYGLAPETKLPDALGQIERAWTFVGSHSGERTRIGLAGDSAGALLSLGLLLSPNMQHAPEFLLLLSPWASLRPIHAYSRASYLGMSTDFVDPRSLNHFGRLGSGAQTVPCHPAPFTALFPTLSYDEFDPESVVKLHTKLCAGNNALSPLDASLETWTKALQHVRGVYINYGITETLAPQAEQLVGVLRAAQAKSTEGTTVLEDVPVAACHAAPMVWAFLGRDVAERMKGIENMVQFIERVCKREKHTA